MKLKILTYFEKKATKKTEDAKTVEDFAFINLYFDNNVLYNEYFT